MKPCFNLILLAVMLFSVTACGIVNSQMTTPLPIPRGPEVYGVFQGNTPCSAQARPLPQIPADTNCDQMIWHLILYKDPQTGSPTTFNLKSAYGLSKQGTNDLIDGGTPIAMKGKWTITTGTMTDPHAIVYQLNVNDSQILSTNTKVL